MQNERKGSFQLGLYPNTAATHNVDAVLPILAGTNIQYFPFPGEIKGHPSVLVGTIDEVVNSAVGLAERNGVHGLDLLAYRSTENATGLMAAVVAAVDKPVIMAGSLSPT